MTNNPFDEKEWEVFEQSDWDRERFLASIRMDDFFFKLQESFLSLRQMGYAVDLKFSSSSEKEFTRFLNETASQANPYYFAISLSSDQLEALLSNPWFIQGVLPWLAEKKLPLALMLGVRRQVNPALGLGGDGMEEVPLHSLERLLALFPENNLMVTTLSQGSQHSLCVLGRKFPNLHIFGFWWFMNQPNLICETLQMRLDLLGLNFIPQHSDARVLEQLVYKWSHFKKILCAVIVERYEKLLDLNWPLVLEDIENDVDLLLNKNAKNWLKLG